MSAATQFTRRTKGPLLQELAQLGADTAKPNAIRCPFHDDRHASAGIYQDKDGVWRFKCHTGSCGVSGDVYDLRARRTGETVEDVLRAESGGESDQPRPKLHDSIDSLKSCCPGTVEALYEYVNPDNGVVEMIVLRCRTDDGKEFRQARPEGSGLVMKAPSKPWPLYNRGRLARAGRVVVVEGEKCVHALADVGIVATTSPAGAGKAEHADWSPLIGKPVVLWPDNDDAGRRHMDQVRQQLERLSSNPSVAVIDPELLNIDEKGDAADFLASLAELPVSDRRSTIEAFLDEAMPVGPASSLLAMMEEIMAGKRRSVPFPWRSMSDATKALRPGSLTLIVGNPGASKSFFVLQCAMYWHDEGIPIAIYELEDGKEDHLLRAVAIREQNAYFTNEEWIEANPEQTRDAMRRHQSWLDSFAARMYDTPLNQLTLDELAGWVQDMAVAGCRVIAIDPITAVKQVTRPWVEDSKFISRIKRIALTYGASIVLVMHPKLGKRRAITLDDLSGSAAYPRFSQCVLAIEKHKPSADVTVMSKLAHLRESRRIDRSVYVRKARHSFGDGFEFGFTFDHVTFHEVGLVVTDD